MRLWVHPDLLVACGSLYNCRSLKLNYLTSPVALPISNPPTASFLSCQPTLSLDPQPRHSLEYSSSYAGIRAKRYLSDCAASLDLKFLDGCNSRISTKNHRKAQKQYVCPIEFDKISLFNGLHCALSSGLLRL